MAKISDTAINPYLRRTALNKKNGNYTKLQPGSNELRILSTQYEGVEYWLNTEDKNDDGSFKKKPYRVKSRKDISQDHLKVLAFAPKDMQPRGFAMYIVYNFAEGEIQLWEITQQSIMDGLEMTMSNVKYANPTTYNIDVIKKGTGLKTTYSIQRGEGNVDSPAKLPQDVQELADGVVPNIKVEAIFTGEDPFANI